MKQDTHREVELIEVIRTRLLLRGNGKDDPYRHIEQYWSLDGELLAEVDHLAQSEDSPS